LNAFLFKTGIAVLNRVKKSAHVDKLDLGHSHFPLSDEILRIWEPLLQKQALKSLYLIHAGTSCLNGKDYYRFSMDLPQDKLDYLVNCLEYCEEIGNYSGWMTALPHTVADALKIQIKNEENN
jgi:hypothetical protein